MLSNKAKSISLVVTPMLTGSISFLASLTIIISILRSDVKLSTSYRRLVFCICVYDLLQSISQAFSSLPLPAGTFWLASGNNTTCTAQGFISTFGLTGTIFYSLSLTIYFLLIVKYDVDDCKITKDVEPILHAVPILFSLVFSIYPLATKNYNIDEEVASCTINSPPSNEETPEALIWINGSSIVIIFSLNCIMMVMIFFAVQFQIKKSQAYRYSWMTPQRAPTCEDSPNRAQEDGTSCLRNILSLFLSLTHLTRKRETEQFSSVLAARLSRPSQASIRRLKETSNRAIGYVLGFLLIYIFPITRIVVKLLTRTQAPFAITFLGKFFYPLQGFLNVIIYTYPHVISYRRNHSEQSFGRAFWEVVKRGGDSDRMQLSPRRRRSLGKLKKALASEKLKKHKKTAKLNFSHSHCENGSLTLPSPFTAAPTVKSAIQGNDIQNELDEDMRDVTVERSSANDYLFPIGGCVIFHDDGSYNELPSYFSKKEDFDDRP